jgi:glycosyltransferase involved in cell wall biosynthesis
MITILHLITGLETGGAEMMMYKLIIRSRHSRHIVVSLGTGGPMGDRIQAAGVPVHTLGIRRRHHASNLKALWRYRRLLKRLSPDLVQTWLYHADLVGAIGSYFDPIPVVWNIRSSEHTGLRTATTRLCVLLSHRPAVVIVNSEAGRRVHERVGYRPRRWSVLPNGFDTEMFAPNPLARHAVRQELGLPADTPLIGMMARYHPQKDHATFLEAARLLAETDTTTCFVLAGRGVTWGNVTLGRLIEAAGLANRVRLVGEREDVAHVTAALDVATLSACSGEGFPNVVGEAMACGVPVAVTAVGDSEHIVGTSGKVVPPRDPRALSEAWRALLALPMNQRERLSQEARARVVAMWSLDHIIGRYESLYMELADRPRDSDD